MIGRASTVHYSDRTGPMHISQQRMSNEQSQIVIRDACVRYSIQSTYSFVPNDTYGQTAANRQLTGPGHRSPLNTLEHAQLLNRIPTAVVQHMEQSQVT